MKTITRVCCLAAIVAVSCVQVPPLVYDVENSGTSYEAPTTFLSVGELPEISTLPATLTFADGSQVKKFSQWEKRRNELISLIEHYEVGVKPRTPQECVQARLEGDSLLVVDVIVGEDTLTMHSMYKRPDGPGLHPVMIGIGFGYGSLPADIFESRDIACLSYPFTEVMSHTQVRGEEPINKLYPESVDAGAYCMWPWGVSRLIDAMEQLQDEMGIDMKHIGITGCSFAGKMALFSGAFDERIALTIAQEPGGGGAASWRVTETLGWCEKLRATNYSWFLESMAEFGECVDRLPIDHHELCALVCPRALLVLGNPDYEWLADPSGYVSCQVSRTVWDAFGIADRMGFSFQDGHMHCMLPDEQRPEVEAFVDRFLLGKDVDTQVTNAPMYEDVDWQKWL